MTTIITGRFQQQDQAQRAISHLVATDFAYDSTATFFVNPAGHHDLHPLGGDEDKSPGMGSAVGGAVSGACVGGAIGVAVGLATLPVLGPAAAAAGAGVGAYAGSLYGALGKTDSKDAPSPPVPVAPTPEDPCLRKSGMIVAVAAATAAQQDSAIQILGAHGATDIERTQGTIVGGKWLDFDPLAPLHLAERV